MSDHEYVISIHVHGSKFDINDLSQALYDFIYSDLNKTGVATVQDIEVKVCAECENDPARSEHDYWKKPTIVEEKYS